MIAASETRFLSATCTTAQRWAALLRAAMLAGLCACFSLVVGTASAFQESAPLDRPSRPDGGEVPAADDETVELSRQVVELMRQAQGRLEQSRFDAETNRLQQGIVEALSRLLERTEQQSARSMPLPMDQPQQSSSQAASSAGGTGAQGSRKPDEAAEAESSEGTGRAGNAGTDAERRTNLATSVWGHLPPRVREQMQSSFNERFLPKYDELVRKYYEALATQARDEK